MVCSLKAHQSMPRYGRQSSLNCIRFGCCSLWGASGADESSVGTETYGLAPTVDLGRRPPQIARSILSKCKTRISMTIG